jgi:tyrosyl-tRNA synthetase
MKSLDVDVALGGMEQRKIQMLAREHLAKLDYEPPVCIHTPLLHGLDGDEKMSSSKGNLIAIDEEEDVIVQKIKKSYCPMKEVEGNPIIEIANHFIFSNQDKILIERPEKFGGNLNLSEAELIDMYVDGDLHPVDLKNAVTEFMIEYLKPVREYMLNK